MRRSCKLCAIKHVAQAAVLCDEALLGYPIHKALAFGHLAEAESELLEKSEIRGIAEHIRNERVQAMENNDYNIDFISILDLLSTIPDTTT